MKTGDRRPPSGQRPDWPESFKVIDGWSSKLEMELDNLERGFGMRLLNLFRLAKDRGPFSMLKLVSARLFGRGTIPCAVLETPRRYLSLIRGTVWQNLNGQPGEIRIEEFAARIAEPDVAGVFILGSRMMGWFETFKQRHHHVAEHLMRNGWIVVCAMNPQHPLDVTRRVRRVGERLFLVNFDDPDSRHDVLMAVAANAKSRVFFHLVGTEPGTSVEEIRALQECGVTIYYEYFDALSKEIFPGLSDFQLRRHAALFRDPKVLVCATAKKLFDDVAAFRTENVFLSRNAVTLEDWDYSPERDGIPSEMEEVVASKRPVIGFYGSFAPWLDYAALRKLAETRPGYEIVMIGYDYEWGKGAFAKSRIADLPNVHIVPAQKYKDLKKFSHWFDVGILPFRIYPLTEAVSPVKIFEYMAQGLPVVAAALPECKLYKSVLPFEDADGFIAQIDRALRLKDDPEYQRQLKADAEANTWRARGEQILSVLEKVPEPFPKRDGSPLLTIGVPLYNMEKFLGNCLDSLLPKRVASEPGWIQVVVVNDGSTDGSLELARGYERKFPGVVEVVDKENGGHGSCINAAVARAKGKYFKLVDSDDWLDPMELLRHLRHLETADADLVVCDYRQVYEDEHRNVVSWNGRLSPGARPAEEVLEALCRHYDHLSYLHMHALTWKTEMLRDVRITERSFYVDQEYITFPMRRCRSIDYQPLCLYQYRLGRPGQSVDTAVVKRRSGQNLAIWRNLCRLHDSLDTRESVFRSYLEGVLYNQSWFYLTHTDSEEGFNEVFFWWKSLGKTTRHPFERLLKRDFTDCFAKRDERIEAVRRLSAGPAGKLVRVLRRLAGVSN